MIDNVVCHICKTKITKIHWHTPDKTLFYVQNAHGYYVEARIEKKNGKQFT